MWSNNTVTLKPTTTNAWTYNSATGRYETESFCPYFKDIYGYTGRNAISCVDQNGKRVGTVRFLGSGMFESFRISLTEAVYTASENRWNTDSNCTVPWICAKSNEIHIQWYKMETADRYDTA